MRLRITTATPKVSKIAAKGSGRVTTRLIRTAWSATPRPNAITATGRMSASGWSHGKTPTSDTPRNALSTMNSPCERLTTRITPTIKASPTPSSP
jgi:hypothetical protein